jgi:hypothetical protein
MTTVQVGPLKVPLGGGAYLRFLPLRLFRMGMEQLVYSREPTVLSVHPWEVDPDQPRQPLGWRMRTNHYHNLSQVESRLQDLLQRFRFAPMGKVLRELEIADRLPAWALDTNRSETRAGVPPELSHTCEEIGSLPEAIRPTTAPGIAAVVSLRKRTGESKVLPPGDEEAEAFDTPSIEPVGCPVLAEASLPSEGEGLREDGQESSRRDRRRRRTTAEPSAVEPPESPAGIEPSGYTPSSRTPSGPSHAEVARTAAQASTVPSSPLEHIFGGFQAADALELLERRKWWLVGGAACGLVLGVLLWRMLPPSYEARTAILVEPQGVPESYIRSTITVGVEDRINTLSERVASHTNLNELIHRVGPERFDPSGELSRDQLMERIRAGLEVEVAAAVTHGRRSSTSSMRPRIPSWRSTWSVRSAACSSPRTARIASSRPPRRPSSWTRS